jgi:excinuclease UvrABC helicase subunit UvrB
MDFKLTSQYFPTGDQPEAIRQLVEGVNNGDPFKPCWVLPDRVKRLLWPM